MWMLQDIAKVMYMQAKANLVHTIAAELVLLTVQSLVSSMPISSGTFKWVPLRGLRKLNQRSMEMNSRIAKTLPTWSNYNSGLSSARWNSKPLYRLSTVSKLQRSVFEGLLL